ncbi:MAG: thioredoxin-like domain-containing protein [Pseudomonadota bacterium]
MLQSNNLIKSVGFLLLLILTGFTEAKTDNPPAIEFDPALPWLNVSRPLTMEELKGKVVILDFWTYGCINCIHVLEDLRRLKERYGDQIAIIGVHTPKFDNEKNIETLRRIVIRYDIDHPVVNDVDSWLGRLYGMRAWPTQYVVDPEGGVLGKVVGEDNFDVFDRAIKTLLKRHADVIDETPLPIALEKEKIQKSLLAAPGKIAVSAQYVAISDTLHHRIILADHDGRIKKLIGGKSPGFADGSLTSARFKSPQGLVFSASGLYVADTGNHSIRFIDLAADKVSTVAGNGKNEIHRGREYAATEIGLRSPWGLALKETQLYIAMAGIHQIWRLDLKNKTIGAYAGSGREGISEGSLKRSSFSQPSGLSLIGNSLYIADAEASALRRIDLDKGEVETLAGTSLFDFGDRDGPLEEAELQHLLGVAAVDDERIFIADTYNHKLKLADLREGTITTSAGTGKPGRGKGEALDAALNEPGGIAVLDDKILIADTNNDRIMQYDLKSRRLSEWPLSEREPDRQD